MQAGAGEDNFIHAIPSGSYHVACESQEEEEEDSESEGRIFITVGQHASAKQQLCITKWLLTCR